MKTDNAETIALRPLQVPLKGNWRNERSGWSLLWISRGRATVHDEWNSQVAESGSVVVIPQGTGTFLKPAQGPFKAHELWFNAERLPCLVSSATRLVFQGIRREQMRATVLPKGNSLTPLLIKLTERQPLNHFSKNGHTEKEFQPKSCPCSFMLHVGAVFEELKSVVGPQGEPTGEVGRKVKNVLIHLTETELQELNVDELARRCGFSRRHLARLVKNQCGSSLATLVAQTRLDKAADLLRDPERKIVNVAMDCGFKHLGAFSAKFRARFGMTPSDWRKNGNGSH